MKVVQVELDLIKPSKQPIRDSLGDLSGLIESISNCGVLQPVKLEVTKKQGRKVLEYSVIFGNRRVEACRQAGLTSIPAIVIWDPLWKNEALKQALTENIQRADMTPLEKGHALNRLMDLQNWTMTDIADAGIMPRKTAAGFLALLKLPEDVQAMICKDLGGRGRDRRTKPLTVEHVAKAATAGEYQAHVLRKAARENLTSRQTHLVAKTVKVALGHEDTARAKSLIDTYEYSDRLFDPDRESKRYGPAVMPLSKKVLTSDIDDQIGKVAEYEPTDFERILIMICRLSNSAQIIQASIENAFLTNEDREQLKHQLLNHAAAVKLLSGIGNLESQ